MDVKVTGAEEFGILARRLKEAGAKDLQKELYAAINRSARPLTQKMKLSTDTYLPGRYAAELSASLRVSTSKLSGRNPAVRLKAAAKTPSGKPRNLVALNRGRLRHPLYGNRRHWFNQAVRPRFYDEPLEQGAPRVRAELVEAIQKVARKIEAGF